MKPTLMSAQAEALCDVQDEGRDDLCLADLCRTERTVSPPWRGDESADDLYQKGHSQASGPSQSPARSAQLWPSSANSSR